MPKTAQRCPEPPARPLLQDATQLLPGILVLLVKEEAQRVLQQRAPGGAREVGGGWVRWCAVGLGEHECVCSSVEAVAVFGVDRAHTRAWPYIGGATPLAMQPSMLGMQQGSRMALRYGQPGAARNGQPHRSPGSIQHRFWAAATARCRW